MSHVCVTYCIPLLVYYLSVMLRSAVLCSLSSFSKLTPHRIPSLSCSEGHLDSGSLKWMPVFPASSISAAELDPKRRNYNAVLFSICVLCDIYVCMYLIYVRMYVPYLCMYCCMYRCVVMYNIAFIFEGYLKVIAAWLHVLHGTNVLVFQVHQLHHLGCPTHVPQWHPL